MPKSEIRTCPMYDPQAAKEDEHYSCMGAFNPGKSDSPYCPRCRANEWACQRKEKKHPGWLRRRRNRMACWERRYDEWAGVTHTHTRGKVVSIATPRKRRNG